MWKLRSSSTLQTSSNEFIVDLKQAMLSGRCSQVHQIIIGQFSGKCQWWSVHLPVVLSSEFFKIFRNFFFGIPLSGDLWAGEHAKTPWNNTSKNEFKCKVIMKTGRQYDKIRMFKSYLYFYLTQPHLQVILNEWNFSRVKFHDFAFSC